MQGMSGKKEQNLRVWLPTSVPTPSWRFKPHSCRHFCKSKTFANYFFNLSSPKPGHTTGGSRRSARRSGGAGSGRTVRQQNCAPREQSFLALCKASKKHRLNVSPEAQTSEILCKPMEEQNQRFITGSSPGREALFVPGC